MRVLVVHNRYQQPGGENSVFAAGTSVLRSRRHDVIEYVEDNDRIDGMRPWTVAANTLWSRSSQRKIRDIIRARRPDLTHFHNTFPLVSPAGYAPCRDEGVPVVQTLHNYRLMCPKSLLLLRWASL